MQHRHLRLDIHQTGQPGNHLRDHGGVGGALHAHTEACHEQNVKQHVNKYGRDQKQQRRAAVAQGAEQAGGQIVQNGGPGAHEYNKNVAVGVVINLRRGVGQAQQRPGEKAGQPGEQQREEKPQPDDLARAAPHSGGIPRAEALGNGDGKAGADPQSKAQDQKVQCAGGAYGGKGLDAQQPAHDDAVGQIIELLKQVSYDKRSAESQNAA